VLNPDPVLHPEDRPDTDESGPWLGLLVASALAWALLAFLDWRVLSTGTFVWATVRSLYTLLLAPLAAAALVQDTRAPRADGSEIGPTKWAYAAVALLFPPVGALYLCHRHVLAGREPTPID
jgi:hypothetical protein